MPETKIHLPDGYQTQMRESATDIPMAQNQLFSLGRALVAVRGRTAIV